MASALIDFWPSPLQAIEVLRDLHFKSRARQIEEAVRRSAPGQSAFVCANCDWRAARIAPKGWLVAGRPQLFKAAALILKHSHKLVAWHGQKKRNSYKLFNEMADKMINRLER